MELNRHKTIFIIGDNNVLTREILGHCKLLGSNEQKIISPTDLHSIPKGSQCVVGFFTHLYRNNFLDKNTIADFTWPNIIHPKSLVNSTANIGYGNVINPYAVLGNETTIGNFCQICEHVHVSHGTKLGNNVFVGSGSMIGGGSNIGNNVWIGMNSTIRDLIRIVDNVNLNMSSVVKYSIDKLERQTQI